MEYQENLRVEDVFSNETYRKLKDQNFHLRIKLMFLDGCLTKKETELKEKEFDNCILKNQNAVLKKQLKFLNKLLNLKYKELQNNKQYENILKEIEQRIIKIQKSINPFECEELKIDWEVTRKNGNN